MSTKMEREMHRALQMSCEITISTIYKTSLMQIGQDIENGCFVNINKIGIHYGQPIINSFDDMMTHPEFERVLYDIIGGNYEVLTPACFNNPGTSALMVHPKIAMLYLDALEKYRIDTELYSIHSEYRFSPVQ